MYLLIPYNRHEVGRGAKFLDVLAVLQSYNCDVNPVVFATYDVIADAESFVSRLATHYPKAKLVKSEDTPYETYPKGANIAFRECVTYMHRLLHREQNTEPFYFLELDTTPLVKDWVEKIKQEYEGKGCTFLGDVRTYYKYTTDKAGVTLKEPDGLYMTGTGVYPADYSEMTNTYKSVSCEAFDLHSRYVVGKKATHSEALISNWRTEKYKRSSKNLLSYQECGKTEILNTPITRSLAAIHGCKDTSLPELIINGGPLRK